MKTKGNATIWAVPEKPRKIFFLGSKEQRLPLDGKIVEIGRFARDSEFNVFFYIYALAAMRLSIFRIPIEFFPYLSIGDVYADGYCIKKNDGCKIGFGMCSLSSFQRTTDRIITIDKTEFSARADFSKFRMPCLEYRAGTERIIIPSMELCRFFFFPNSALASVALEPNGIMDLFIEFEESGRTSLLEVFSENAIFLSADVRPEFCTDFFQKIVSTPKLRSSWDSLYLNFTNGCDLPLNIPSISPIAFSAKVLVRETATCVTRICDSLDILDTHRNYRFDFRHSGATQTRNVERPFHSRFTSRPPDMEWFVRSGSAPLKKKGSYSNPKSNAFHELRLLCKRMEIFLLSVNSMLSQLELRHYRFFYSAVETPQVGDDGIDSYFAVEIAPKNRKIFFLMGVHFPLQNKISIITGECPPERTRGAMLYAFRSVSNMFYEGRVTWKKLLERLATTFQGIEVLDAEIDLQHPVNSQRSRATPVWSALLTSEASTRCGISFPPKIR
ncbi:hypothetical protein [Poseidonocella sp. HB161398]|uniref:hypothetical protein n=1 Tax=Poseidonocella sp. HB161398 TaxID=2320855 RepID=UPI001109C8A4|nr:hypothetical protein [Poseidonocella sp. HB161398]